MSLKAGRVFSALTIFALGAAGVYCFAKRQGSGEMLSKKCTDLHSKINDLQADIDLLYEELEAHRFALESMPQSDHHIADENSGSTPNSLGIVVKNDSSENIADLAG